MDKQNARIEVCKFCNEEFYLGYNGTVVGCDECARVTRDENGSISFSSIDNKKIHDELWTEWFVAQQDSMRL